MSKDDGTGADDSQALKATFDKVVRALNPRTADERVRVLHAVAIVFGIEKALVERLASS